MLQNQVISSDIGTMFPIMDFYGNKGDPEVPVEPDPEEAGLAGHPMHNDNHFKNRELPISGPTDIQLVVMAQAGDKSAFDRLMLRHQNGVASYLRRYSASPEVVEDLTQIVFVKAYLHLDTYHPIAPFFNWLRSIAARTGYDFWRRDKRDRMVFHDDLESIAASVSEPTDRTDEYEELTRIMNMLSPDERQVLSMLYTDGLSIADIASTMGWNVSMTKMRAFRARKKLRKYMKRG